MDRKWIALSNTTIGTFMALLDSSIVIISLPTIGRQLPGAGPGELLWTVLSYNLVTTTLLLSLGRLSDMFGRVRLYVLGFALFTLGSGLSAFSATGAELLASRIVQGVGAGFLFSNSVAILTDAFPRPERGRALGLNQVAAISGSMLGLVLGGILTTAFGWRSIFLVNLPIGVLGTVWAYVSLRETHRELRPGPVDWLGNLTFGVGLTVMLVGVTLGGLDGWSSPLVLGLLLAGPPLLALFVWAEGLVPAPMFDLALFRIRTFVTGNFAALLAALARGAFTFVMVFYFQGVLGDSAEAAGILLLPISVAFAIAGPISGTISDRTGARYLGSSGLTLSSLGFLLLLLQPTYTDYRTVAVAMVLLGVGQGMFAAPNRAEVMSSVPPARRGLAAGVGSTFLNGGNLGSLAIGFTLLAGTLPRSSLAAVFTGAGPGGAVDVGAFLAALHVLFAVALVLTLVAAGINLVRGPAPPRSDARETHRSRSAHPRGHTAAWGPARPGDGAPP